MLTSFRYTLVIRNILMKFVLWNSRFIFVCVIVWNLGLIYENCNEIKTYHLHTVTEFRILICKLIWNLICVWKIPYCSVYVRRIHVEMDMLWVTLIGVSFLQVQDLGKGHEADVGAGPEGGGSASSLQLEVQGLVTIMMAMPGERSPGVCDKNVQGSPTRKD